MKKLAFMSVLLFAVSIWSACKKLVNTDLPSKLVTADYVFNNDKVATSAALNNYLTINGYFVSVVGNSGAYADEFNGTSPTSLAQIYASSILTPDNGTLLSNWKSLYSIIYQSNNILANVNNSSHLSDTTKTRLYGEAEFCRAYAYFNLINTYGDVPMVTATDVNQTALSPRINTSNIYELIIKDLVDAKSKLRDVYAGEGKVRATKWAASALLAKVYLYQKQWANAAAEATAVINSGQFQIVSNLSQIFLKDSQETILQLWNQNGFSVGASILGSVSAPPNYAVTTDLLNSFPSGDQRKGTWLKTSYSNGGVNYYYSYKYRASNAQDGAGPNAEYFILLRLADIYLVRSEAKANLNDIPGAIADLNMVHQRAGLSPYPATYTQNQLISLIQLERRLELFAEGNDRFFDLKRTGQIDNVMQAFKPTWKPTAKVYPIPQQEILYDSQLTQNPGY